MIGPTSQCSTCSRFRSPFSRGDGDFSGGPFCAAFPGGIPSEILRNEADHRKPFPGDNGVRWEPDGDAEFPDWALASPTNRASGTPMNVADPRDVDLSEVEREFSERLDSLWSGWDQISAEWRRQIVDQVRVAVTANDLNALAAISVSTTAAQEALVEAMVDMALTAANRMAREAKDQGTPIDPVASDSALFTAIAAVAVALLADGMGNAAGREALRQWSPTTSGDDVSRSVDEHLRQLSDAFPRQQLGAALTSAQNTGRLNTALSGPSGALYASEVMDRNTCPPCAQVDGKWLGNTDDPATPARVAEVYPNGGYRFCEGGVRCRGTVITIYRPQQVSGEAA